MNRIRNVTLVAACVGMLVALGACYTTKFSLGTREQAVVDRKFVGNWEIPDKDDPGKPPVLMLIRNIDSHQYYVEYDEHNGKGPVRWTGYVIDLKGVSFAHLRPLDDDGELSEECALIRVGMTSDGKLTFRQLADNDKPFWKDHPVNSNEDLRKVIEANLDNEQMYEADTFVATRARTQ